MASGRSISSGQQTKSTKPTTVSKPNLLSAYDKAFEQHLFGINVYLHGRKSKPKNNADLYQPRLSLSPSKFSDGAFEQYQDEHDYLGSKGDVMRKIIPVISGSANIPNSGEVLFSNLESITGGAIADVKPDFYDGARFNDIDATVRNHLNNLIIPSDTNAARRPAAPNFFLEAKAPWGAADVAKRQAGIDRAIGARAMHALQNYGVDEPVFDGNAYTYSSTYHAGTGTLQLYAHHVTPPTAPGGRPEYHMTLLDSYAMTGKRERFVEGATAFRNARDLAQRHRDSLIQAANARQHRSNVEAPPEGEITVAVTEQEEEEPSQESISLSADPAMSFTRSFTSFTAPSQASSKRTRASNSPPSNAHPHEKHDSAKKRTRRSASRRAAESSTQASASTGSAVPQPDSAEEY